MLKPLSHSVSGRLRRTLYGAVLSALVATMSGAEHGLTAQQPAPPANSPGSPAPAAGLDALDRQLLEDLGPPSGKPTVQPGGQAASPEETPAGPAVSDLDKKLLEELGGLPPADAGGAPPVARPPQRATDAQPPAAGEDLGGAPRSDDANPLSRIGQQMRVVETRLEQRDLSRRTQDLQDSIITELDRMIQLLQQQQQQQQQNQQPTTPQPGSAASGEPQPGDKPTGESTDRLGTAEAEAGEVGQLPGILKEVWGHLPDRVRAEMRSSAMERFLPKYEDLIKEYYKRLATEALDQP